MLAAEFKRVYKCAEERNYPQTPEFFQQASIALMGFGLIREGRKCCTVQQAAYVLNYQTIMMNGIRDAEALAETRLAYLKNVDLVD